MNKQNKQIIGAYTKKIQSCSDELSCLLDLIYKFPQHQRQKYYQRIQLLKQNLTQIKTCIKELQTSSGLNAIQKKYQQIYIKINELKNQINSSEYGQNSVSSIMGANSGNLGKKRRYANQLQISVTQNSKQLRSGLGVGTSKSQQQYEQIMQTIVSKDQEIKKYRQQLQNCRALLKSYSTSEAQAKIYMQQLQVQLRQQARNNETNRSQYHILQRQHKETIRQNQLIVEQYSKQKQAYNIAKIELANTKQMYEQCMMRERQLKQELQRHILQLTSLQQKYKYETKQSLEREQLFKMKERSLDKQIQKLTHEMTKYLDMDLQSKNKQYLVENMRYKQDIKVLQAELTLKQQCIYEKNKKYQSLKQQFNQFKQQIEEQERNMRQSLEQSLRKNKQFYSIQVQSDSVISLLQKKIKEIQLGYAELQESKLMVQRKLRDQQKVKERELLQKQEFIRILQQTYSKQHRYRQQEIDNLRQQVYTTKQQMYRTKLNLQVQQQTIGKLQQQRLCNQSECERVNLQNSKTQTKIQEMMRAMQNIQHEKLEYCRKFQACVGDVKDKDQLIRKLERELESLKKRLIKAKIQAIRDIREVIV